MSVHIRGIPQEEGGDLHQRVESASNADENVDYSQYQYKHTDLVRQITVDQDQTMDQINATPTLEDVVLREQVLRLETMRNVCKTLKSTDHIDRDTYSHLVVDDDRQILYCRIFKVSSTTLRKALVNSSGRVEPHIAAKLNVNNMKKMAKYGFFDINTFTWENVMYRVQKYFKFIFVRHPLKRLVSAFRDKFRDTHPHNIRTYQKGYGTKIIKRYRKHPSRNSLRKGHDVTFEEFLRFVIDTKLHQDGHWRTYASNCHPCIINYDFIGKLETMTQDAQYIMDRISTRKVPFPEQWMGPSSLKNSTQGTDQVYLELYKSVSKDVIVKLIEVYADDMKMFGYDVDPEILH